MRIDYVKDASIASAGDEAPKIVIEMEYLPDCSKNKYKLRDGTVKRQVREWMECLAFMVQAMKNSASLEFKPPITVRIDGVFKDKRSMPDIHNFLVIICDAIEDALGINDRDYKTETGLPRVGDDPRLIITISGGE